MQEVDQLDIQKNIAVSIRAAMDKSDLSIAEFSKELNIGKSSLQAYLNGTQCMRSDTIELIAKKMGVTPAELVSGSVLTDEVTVQDEPLHPMLHPIAQEIEVLKNSIMNISANLYKVEAQINASKKEGLHKK